MQYIGEKVTTMKITMSKTKKNIQKFINHHYIKKCLFSSSLLRHQNIKIDKDHYYKNQNVKKNEKNIESLSFV